MRQRGAFFLVLSWSVLGTPAVGQGFPNSMVGDVIEPDGASQGVDRIATVCQMIKSAASANDLPADFLLRVIWQESRFKSDAIGPVTRSGARALGIAQFMPATAAERELTRPFDPAQALPKAAEFLRELRSEFGNIGLASCRRLQCGSTTCARLARRKAQLAWSDPGLRADCDRTQRWAVGKVRTGAIDGCENEGRLVH
jgi:Transglycosylase SLT domain